MWRFASFLVIKVPRAHHEAVAARRVVVTVSSRSMMWTRRHSWRMALNNPFVDIETYLRRASVRGGFGTVKRRLALREITGWAASVPAEFVTSQGFTDQDWQQRFHPRLQ